MDKDYEKIYTKIEQENWWFVGRRDLIKKSFHGLINKQILEVGCGTGLNLKAIKDNNFVRGLDASEYFVKNRVVPNIILGDANVLPFEKESFDYVMGLDIIEHLENDVRALQGFKKVLKNNGKLILTVPALQIIYGPHDKINKHYRRYSKRQLRDVLTKAGFKDIRISYWNSFLFVPVFFVKLLKKFSKGDDKPDVFVPPKFINEILIKILRFENYIIINGFNLPIGISLFAVASK